MTVFKCKMCGGSIDVVNNESVAECEYCGTKQTLPTAQDENLQALFNRANQLRMKSEFDRAEKLSPLHRTKIYRHFLTVPIS